MIFSWVRETHILCRLHTLFADKPLRGCTGEQENKSKIKEHFQGCWGSALTPARGQINLSPGASLITSGCDLCSWRIQPGWKHLGTAGFAVSGTCKGFSSKPAWKQISNEAAAPTEFLSKAKCGKWVKSWLRKHGWAPVGVQGVPYRHHSMAKMWAERQWLLN